MPNYVLHEDIDYLDLTARGHIVSYSILLEYQAGETDNIPIVYRIWIALPENLELMSDPDMGSIIKLLGSETSRAYI